MTSDTVYLSRIEGFARKSGTDPSGNKWIEWDTDGSECSHDYCEICHAFLESGWVCLDGGEVVCDLHVSFVPEWMADKLAADITEEIEHRNTMVAVRCIVGQAAIDHLGARQNPNRYLGYVMAP